MKTSWSPSKPWKHIELMTLFLLGSLVGFLDPSVKANLVDSGSGVFVDDFRTAQIDQLKPGGMQPPKTLELVDRKGKKALHLVGAMQSTALYDGRVFKDFVLEVDMEKGQGRSGYAGVAVRDNCYVYFQMKRYLCIGGPGTGQSSGDLWKSSEIFDGPRKLKVVCVGPMLSVYVDGELQTRQRIVATEGKVGFYAHGGGEGFYQRISVNPKVDPKESLAVEVQAPGDALVFAPEESVSLKCVVSNHSAAEQSLVVSLAVKTWDGKVVKEKSERQVKVNADAPMVVEFPLGKLPAGFYRVELQANSGGASVCDMNELPLAIQKVESVEFKKPRIPVAAYSEYYCEKTPVFRNTYTHAVARILRENHFNAIVADAGFTKEVVDIYQRYGVATIARSGRLIEHPAVIATLQRDEPKPDEIDALKADYARIEAGGKSATTCMIGEGMGLGSPSDPVNIWRKLEPRLRAFRWYGVKKTYYNTLYEVKSKGWLPLPSVLRVTEASSDTPWWFIPQSFGRADHEAYYMNPTAAEMRGMMHLAMAHGADGLMHWCLQNWFQSKSEWIALIQQKSLQPTDGKLAAAGQVAGLIEKHAELLATLRYGAFDIQNSNPIHVEAVPRRTDAGHGYIYVVNKDAGARATTRLAFKGNGAVRDLFSGKDLAVSPSPRSVELTLEPGDAALLDVGEMGSEARPVVAASGSPTLDGALAARIGKDGVTVLRANLAEIPCVPGDAIGLSRSDDPRNVWAKMADGSRAFSWSGLLDARTAEGYLPLPSALRVAEAYSTNSTFQVVYPALNAAKPSPGQLRAMLHLALAYGTGAVVVPEKTSPELSTVVDEVAGIAQRHGKMLGDLHGSGLDVRCRNAMIAAIPRGDGAGVQSVYAVNLDTEKAVTAPLLLWAEVWTWTKARDVFAGRDLTVSPTDKEGYLACEITLGPGEGKLVVTDAKSIKK